MEPVKNCTTCKHHQNKESIDDVADECFPCVHHRNVLGYYPNWEPTEKSIGQLLKEKLEEPYNRDDEWRDNFNQDNVNSPKHYTTGGIETIDYIRAKLGVSGTIAYCMGNVIKYTSRWQDKNGLEDLLKALWYLNYAINLMKESNASE